MNRALFFNHLRVPALFGAHIQTAQVAGVERYLDAWEHIESTGDLRCLAYILATAFHETGRVMQPVREIGRGEGKRYGRPAGPYHLIYYGRGDVQLTWYGNYLKADTALHKRDLLKPNESLVKTPDLALRPDLAAAILIFGMLKGWFTGRRLSDFFIGTRSDWVDARTIINGHDRAALIAGYALHFYHALQVATAKLAA